MIPKHTKHTDENVPYEPFLKIPPDLIKHNTQSIDDYVDQLKVAVK